MSKIRTSVIGVAATVALVLGGGVLTTTVANASPAAPIIEAVSENSGTKYEGEPLFRAIVFGQGEAASKLEGLTNPVDVTPEVEGEIDRIVAQMKSIDETYFDRFAELAQSGDVLKVENAFTETGDVLNEALTALGYGDGSVSGEVSTDCIQVVLFAVAVLVYAGAAVLQVAAVAVTWLYKGYASRTSGESELAREKWIASVTTALA